MTPSLIEAMTTADAVAAVLDADRLSELLQRPVLAARLRIKPEVSVLVSLTDRSTGLTAGWARLLWPVSHSKAAQTERLAASLGLQPPITRSLDEGLLLQCGAVLTDPKLAEPLAQVTDLGVLSTWEARDVLRYNPSRRLVLRDGATSCGCEPAAGDLPTTSTAPCPGSSRSPVCSIRRPWPSARAVSACSSGAETRTWLTSTRTTPTGRPPLGA